MAIIAEQARSEIESCVPQTVPVRARMRLTCAKADTFRGRSQSTFQEQIPGEFEGRSRPEVI